MDCTVRNNEFSNNSSPHPIRRYFRPIALPQIIHNYHVILSNTRERARGLRRSLVIRLASDGRMDVRRVLALSDNTYTAPLIISCGGEAHRPSEPCRAIIRFTFGCKIINNIAPGGVPGRVIIDAV